MSTWRRRFSRESGRLNERDEMLMHNAVRYRKKLQAAITQISRTKKAAQRHLDSSDSEVHVARLINDIGQMSDCKSLQEISSLIDSLAMRQQLSSKVFHEYAMDSLQQPLRKLNDDLSHDFEEALSSHCSEHTKKQLLTKVQSEWSKHKKLAVNELKRGLASYCDIGLYHLQLQTAILRKLQTVADQLSADENDLHIGLPNFSASSLETRRDIDTMLRIMLDSAPNDSNSSSSAKRPKFLSNHVTLPNSLYSAEITEAAARSNRPSIGQRNPGASALQYSSMMATTADMPPHEPTILSPLRAHTGPHSSNTSTPADDHLPSYTDLFVVPRTCEEDRHHRRITYLRKQ